MTVTHAAYRAGMKRKPAVWVQQTHKTFHGVAALRGVSLRVECGERVALLGASGSGKSTLIRILSGLERQDAHAGDVEVLGQTLHHGDRVAPQARAIRRDVGVIFQQFNLVGRLPLMTNVLMGLCGRIPTWRALLGRFSTLEQAQAFDALARLGLQAQAYQRASTLSGGQQQRAAIARTLVQRARVVLADEPVASLDPDSTKRVMDHLLELNEDQGITTVVSLHQVELARRYFQRIVALRHGEVVFDGPACGLDSALIAELYGNGARELLDPMKQPSHVHLQQAPAWTA
jgi:phosphonate transport system ATP-binding protein